MGGDGIVPTLVRKQRKEKEEKQKAEAAKRRFNADPSDNFFCLKSVPSNYTKWARITGLVTVPKNAHVYDNLVVTVPIW